MTTEEMAKLFGVLSLAYPSSKMFEPSRFDATVKLWSGLLADIPMWRAELAAQNIMRKSKYMPSIAEFREYADDITKRIEETQDEAFDRLKTGVNLYGFESYMSMLPEHDIVKRIVNRLGRERLYIADGAAWNMYAIKDCVASIIHATPSVLMLSGRV